MLTYENVNNGLRVEVLHNEQILQGTVLYKGPMTGRPGLWIGIDLTTPDGDNDGTLRGRVYFRAPMNYGLFTTIENVRLASNFRRKQRSYYRTVNKKSIVEEELFGNTDPTTLPPPRTDSSISNAKVSYVLDPKQIRPDSAPTYPTQQRFLRPQSLSRMKDEQLKKSEALRRSQINTKQHTFSPAPSIPRIYMPACEIDRVKRQGFGQLSLPRYTVVHDQFDFLE